MLTYEEINAEFTTARNIAHNHADISALRALYTKIEQELLLTSVSEAQKSLLTEWAFFIDTHLAVSQSTDIPF